MDQAVSSSGGRLAGRLRVVLHGVSTAAGSFLDHRRRASSRKYEAASVNWQLAGYSSQVLAS